MAIPILPILVTIGRSLLAAGPRAIAAFGRAGATVAGRTVVRGAMPAGARAAGRRGRAVMDMASLARHLGTPAPSQAQQQSAQSQIDQYNQQFSTASRIKSVASDTGEGIQELGKLAIAAHAANKGLSAFARTIHGNALESLKMFSSAFAAEAARMNAHNMRMAIERARNTQGTNRRLGEAIRRNDKAWAPYSDLQENLVNAITKFGLNLSSMIADGLEMVGITDVVRRVNEWFNEGEPGAEIGGPLGHYIRSTLAGSNLGPLSNRPNEPRGARR